jgi:phosphatidylglycerol---prolipoprotein diacylglyceryl transferase
MIPYIKVPDLKLGPLSLHPFGVLVATGVLIGTALAMRRARRLGYDVKALNSFITWMLVVGFIGGHVLDEIFYHWDMVVARPYSLLFLWEGLSSFGGFTGALIGGILWKYIEYRGFDARPVFKIHKPGRPIFVFADLILSVFPVAWIFGRSGCSVVHDHPGMRTTENSIFAVLYPLREGEGRIDKYGPIELIYGSDPRFDLGLLEMMFTVVLALMFALTWRRKLPVGTYAAVASLAYAPVRFAMDFLRVHEKEGGDTRYMDLTPAQWECTALFALGIGILIYTIRMHKQGIDPAKRWIVGAQ